MTNCPLCSIPITEPLLYTNKLIYLVRTKDDKGHFVRVMAATHRHTTEPTFEERLQCYFHLYEYMSDVQTRRFPWYIVDSTYCSNPDHFHVMACDEYSNDPREEELLAKTPKIMLPVHNNVLIGIPAHNEVDNIGKVVREARKYGWVLVYCDACTDSTAHSARLNGAQFILEGKERAGYGGGLQKIFSFAREEDFDHLVTLDGDGQHDPSQIPQFLWALETGADVVIGNRFLGQHNTPRHRQLVIKTLNTILGVGDSQCGFRAYNRKAIDTIHITETGMGASLDILKEAKQNDLSIAEVPCTVTYTDEPTHITPTVAHGRMLMDTLFWNTVWTNPLYIVLPTLFCLLLGSYWLVKTIVLYRTLDTFATGLAIAGFGLVSLSFILVLLLVLVLVGKRIVKETRK